MNAAAPKPQNRLQMGAHIEPIGSYKWELTGPWGAAKLQFDESTRKWVTTWAGHDYTHGALQQALSDAYNRAMGYVR